MEIEKIIVDNDNIKKLSKLTKQIKYLERESYELKREREDVGLKNKEIPVKSLMMTLKFGYS